MTSKGLLYFIVMFVLLLTVGILQSWNVAFGILNLCLISAIMSLGVNIQWGYAGLFNVGIMGFAALGGVATVLISMPPVKEAWQSGGLNILCSAILLIATVLVIKFVKGRMAKKWALPVILVIGLIGLGLTMMFYNPGVEKIESINPAYSGYLGGLGLPVVFSWVAGGLIAAGAAWFVGKIALGLRADYLAIATLGISEIIIAILKYEEWLTRGVKNVTGLPRPVPYEVDIIENPYYVQLARNLGVETADMASLMVKISYCLLFLAVLFFIFWLSEKALHSPWGRMMKAIRDNRDAASAMGKNVTRQHLQVFILGCAVCGVAGAMLTTLDGQLTPSSYIPMRYTFLIWVMVILGGSGNNWGSVLGGFVVWFLWIEAEPLGNGLVNLLTFTMADSSALKQHLIASTAYFRLIMMGAILLLVLRFFPKGLIPEK